MADFFFFLRFFFFNDTATTEIYTLSLHDALPILLVSTQIAPFMPWMLAFAAGAMIYVVVEELIPEAHLGEHSNIGTLGVIAGFVVMMVLDVALG